LFTGDPIIFSCYQGGTPRHDPMQAFYGLVRRRTLRRRQSRYLERRGGA
jgi:hypothetical protein